MSVNLSVGQLAGDGFIDLVRVGARRVRPRAGAALLRDHRAPHPRATGPRPGDARAGHPRRARRARACAWPSTTSEPATRPSPTSCSFPDPHPQDRPAPSSAASPATGSGTRSSPRSSSWPRGMGIEAIAEGIEPRPTPCAPGAGLPVRPGLPARPPRPRRHHRRGPPGQPADPPRRAVRQPDRGEVHELLLTAVGRHGTPGRLSAPRAMPDEQSRGVRLLGGLLGDRLASKPASVSSRSQVRRPKRPSRCVSCTTRTEPSASRSRNAYSVSVHVSAGSGSQSHSR